MEPNVRYWALADVRYGADGARDVFSQFADEVVEMTWVIKAGET